MKREMDRRVHLLRRLILARGEALEVHDQELRRPRDDDLLRGFPLALAVRAFPHLVLAQSFLLAVTAQAIVDVGSFALLRDFDTDAVEGFVGRGGVLACGAAEAAGVLAGEEVRDEGCFAVGVALPFDPGDFLYGHAFACEFLFDAQGNEGLFLPTLVEVFVQAVEEEVEVFLGVLLSVEAPFWVQAGAETAQGYWADGMDVAFPEAADEVGVDLRHDAVRAFPVLDHVVAPSVVKEELRERYRGEKALNCCIHVAGDSKVDEAGTWEFQIVGDGTRCIQRRLCGRRCS